MNQNAEASEPEAAEHHTATETATFAGGCFWCMEPPFRQLPGVLSVESGYTGGVEKNPRYEDVAGGKTGHAEAVRIRFDPSRIRYDDLLAVFWRQIDPTDAGGQFVDRGRQYRPAIFVHDAAQRRAAEASLARKAESGRFDGPIAVEIVDAGAFWPAEDYHQDYANQNPIRYKFYRSRSGRDSYLSQTWGADREWVPIADTATPSANDGGGPRWQRPDDAELRQRLSPLQWKVVREDGTEPAFRNAWWDHKEAGIYVDIASGEPLFSSLDKYDSGTGWPSFTRPLEPAHIVEREDRKLWMVRTEVRSRYGDSHLGHVFPDGPAPTGLRYCINSAALRFVPADRLEAEGYGKYRRLFE